MIPPALRGIIRYAIKSHWPSLIVTTKDNSRESNLLIQWRGSIYELSCKQLKLATQTRFISSANYPLNNSRYSP